MDYDTTGTEDIESVVPEEYGGMWFFRDSLGCENLGMTLLELEAGGKGKAHDHAEADHEEAYLVVDGELMVELGGSEGAPEAEEALVAGEAIRVAPETRRQLHNRSDKRVRVVIAGAP